VLYVKSSIFILFIYLSAIYLSFYLFSFFFLSFFYLFSFYLSIYIFFLLFFIYCTALFFHQVKCFFGISLHVYLFLFRNRHSSMLSIFQTKHYFTIKPHFTHVGTHFRIPKMQTKMQCNQVQIDFVVHKIEQCQDFSMRQCPFFILYLCIYSFICFIIVLLYQNMTLNIARI